HSGWLALQAGIAAGVDMVLVPEVPLDVEVVLGRMKEIRASGKTHFVLVTAEGVRPSATEIHTIVNPRKDEIGYESRLTILGSIQRGCAPTAFDRLHATRVAAKGVDELMETGGGTVIGFRNMQTITTPIAEAIKEPPPFSEETYRMCQILAG